ncbi:ankyrin repeat protein [Catovirus CTV1]|uniref:Ankyrin repeat protein n=1 Tax=Catovirus CTV1 TaxID=1977631 RepID=A0A1V0S8U3_9VIRU|nr:ankyrin repeat protein [Catovirus CTV1]
MNKYYEAVIKNDLSEIKSFQKNIDTNNIIIFASKMGRLEIVKYFISMKITRSSSLIDNALISAAENGHLNIVEFFVLYNANIYADDYRAIILACQNNHISVVKFFIRKSDELNDNCYVSYALTAASQYNRLDIAKLLIDKCKNDKDILNQAIIYAVQNNHIEIVEFLIKNGADDYDQMLQNASSYGNLKIVELCITQSISKVDIDWALIRACQKDHLHVVKYLISIGANKTAKNNLPLINAANNNNLNIIKYLIDNGVSAMAENNIAIITAARRGYYDTVEYLISMGAAIDFINDHMIDKMIDDNFLELAGYIIDLNCKKRKFNNTNKETVIKLISLLYNEGKFELSLKLLDHFGHDDYNMIKSLFKIHDSRNIFKNNLRFNYCDVCLLIKH